MEYQAYPNGIEVEEVEGGLLVRQRGEAYVARNWRLTAPFERLIQTALESGLGCMIREDHPLRKARWPNERGVVYLAFSAAPDLQWSVAIDTFRAGRGDYGHAVFNGKYHTQFVEKGIPFVFEGRNKTSGHLVVARDTVIPTLKALSDFDHSVLALNRTVHQGDGFTTEYVIQHSIIANWEQTPWGERYDIVQDEFLVDGGLTSRRMARRSRASWPRSMATSSSLSGRMRGRPPRLRRVSGMWTRRVSGSAITPPPAWPGPSVRQSRPRLMAQVDRQSGLAGGDPRAV
jgi:hypothetical protein